MRVRPATWADIDRCEELDGSYATNYVWQMDESLSPSGMNMAFQRVRIPRPLEVVYPRPRDLYADWQRNECFLVAEQSTALYGYLDMTVCRWQWRGYIEHLITHKPYRRQGVAARLLQAAEQWARGSDLNAIVMAVQNKNDPAITLLSQKGYRFCGFMDRYYANGDVAMMYALTL